MEIDPVSGNEIPPGVGPEQVRDDVEANLSEGEYIVPADVVKYFGVAHFEKLRDKAKAGMLQLDEGGRIGGEPSEEVLEMDEGGLVPGKSDFNPMDYKTGFSIGNAPATTTQAVADPVCPDGYSWDEGSKTCKPVAPASPTGSSGSSTSNRTIPAASNPNSWMESFSYNDPQELFNQTMASIKTEESETDESGGVLSTLFSGAKSLVAGGLAGGLLGKFMSTSSSARAAANASVLRTSGFPELADQIDAQNNNFVADRGITNVPETWRDGDVLANNIQSAKGDVMSAWSTSAPVPTAAQAPITKDQGFTGSDDTGMPTVTKQNTSGTGQTKTPNLPNTPPPSVSAPTTTTANTPPPGLASRPAATSTPSKESMEEKRKRGGGFAKGGLVTKRTKKNK